MGKFPDIIFYSLQVTGTLNERFYNWTVNCDKSSKCLMMYCRVTTPEGRRDENSVWSQEPAGDGAPGHLQHARPL